MEISKQYLKKLILEELARVNEQAASYTERLQFLVGKKIVDVETPRALSIVTDGGSVDIYLGSDSAARCKLYQNGKEINPGTLAGSTITSIEADDAPKQFKPNYYSINIKMALDKKIVTATFISSVADKKPPMLYIES